TVIRDHVIDFPIDSKGGPNLSRLVTHCADMEVNSPLPVQNPGAFIQPPAEEHIPVHFQQSLFIKFFGRPYSSFSCHIFPQNSFPQYNAIPLNPPLQEHYRLDRLHNTEAIYFGEAHKSGGR